MHRKPRLLPLQVLSLAILLVLAASTVRAETPGVVLQGKTGPLTGKNIVLIAADDEYRSEELIPQLAKILATHHGCKCTVLFAIDPKTGFIDPGAQNIPGLEALDSANLLVLFARFRELPDEQMKHFVDYIESGKPIIGLRTATHAFNYTRHKDSPYAKYSFNNAEFSGGFGRQVLGETWINHYGNHNVESTRAIVAPGMEQHPILRGVGEIWGPSDVYAVTTLTGDSKPLLLGHVLVGMKPTDPPNEKKKPVPVAWTKTYTGAGQAVAGLHDHDGALRRFEVRGFPPPAGQRLLLVHGPGREDSRQVDRRSGRQVRAQSDSRRRVQEKREAIGLSFGKLTWSCRVGRVQRVPPRTRQVNDGGTRCTRPTLQCAKTWTDGEVHPTH